MITVIYMNRLMNIQHLKPTHENIIRNKRAPEVDRDLTFVVVVIDESIEHFRSSGGKGDSSNCKMEVANCRIGEWDSTTANPTSKADFTAVFEPNQRCSVILANDAIVVFPLLGM
jgi:hypothetical protein